MSATAAASFERLVRDFLGRHTALRHQWRPIRDRVAGDRLDLVFAPPSAKVPEVWVTLRDQQIAVGAAASHEDFEDFGRRLSGEQVAQEALARLIVLLREHGYVTD